ncbi:MAG: acyl carrier protein [Simkaniaceae bacterium]
MSVEQEVTDIIVEQLGVDKDDVSAEKSFVEDLNADSLDLTELIMTFEERFGLEISEGDAEQLNTFGVVIEFVSKKKVATNFSCSLEDSLKTTPTL